MVGEKPRIVAEVKNVDVRADGIAVGLSVEGPHNRGTAYPVTAYYLYGYRDWWITRLGKRVALVAEDA